MPGWAEGYLLLKVEMGLADSEGGMLVPGAVLELLNMPGTGGMFGLRGTLLVGGMMGVGSMLLGGGILLVGGMLGGGGMLLQGLVNGKRGSFWR